MIASGGFLRVLLGIVAVAVAAAAAAQTNPSDTVPGPLDGPRQLVAALHVHSTASSGELTLRQLSRTARQAGIDVLVLAENLGYEFRYAPAVLRFFGEAHVSTPTLEHYGIERFLADLEETTASDESVLLLPGVEVAPYYYWTGSLLSGDLTLNDMQRNLLVIPALRREDSRGDVGKVLRDLPTVGNRNHRRFGARSSALLLPGLLIVGLSLLQINHRRPFQRRDPRLLLALAGVTLGAALLWANFPFAVSPLAPYDARAGYQPAQSLLDYAHEQSALAFWSMPQATDYRDRSVGPFNVRLSTDPYPDVLSATTGYTGFGGVYADAVSLWEPGAGWDDRLLVSQSNGDAATPWLVGESAFHYSGQAGKRLDDILTVLLVDERTREAAFEALAGGHSYTLRRQAGSADLRLTEFAMVPSDEGPRHAGAPVARLGDTLRASPAGETEMELSLRVEDLAGGATPIEVEIVRNGVLHRRIEGTAPLEGRWPERLDADETTAYFRVIVRAAPPAYLVSNPIFVHRGASGGGQP